MYLSIAKSLFSNLFWSKRFQEYHVGIVIFCYIAFIPTFLFALAGCVTLAVVGFVADLIKTPTDYLLGIIRNEVGFNKENRGVGIVLYLLSWPTVFTSYTLLSFITVVYELIFLVTELATWAFSTGSFRFVLNPFTSNVNELEPKSTVGQNRVLEKVAIYDAINLLFIVVGAIIFINSFGPSSAFTAQFLAENPCFFLGDLVFLIRRIIAAGIVLGVGIIFHYIYAAIVFRK